LLYDREGSLFAGISRRLLCSSCTGVGLAPWPLAVDHPRRGLTTVHIVFNHCRQLRTPGPHLGTVKLMKVVGV